MALAFKHVFVFVFSLLFFNHAFANPQLTSSPLTNNSEKAPIQGSDELDILKGFASFRDNLKNRTLQLLTPVTSALKSISDNDEVKDEGRIEKLKTQTNKGDDIVDRDMEELSRAYDEALNSSALENSTTDSSGDVRRGEFKPDPKFPYYIISDDFNPVNMSALFNDEDGSKSLDYSSDDSVKTRGSFRTMDFRNEQIEQSQESNETYHVKYETKFSFQNVDENGLKVKYNKTEHVYYGDADTFKPTPAKPSGRRMEETEVISRGRCIFQSCDKNGTCQAKSDCDTTYCDPDYTKPYPECCVCLQNPYTLPIKTHELKDYDGYRSERFLPIQLVQTPHIIEQVKILKTQERAISDEEESQERETKDEEEDMSDLDTCQYMNFEENEFEKELPGVCAMCRKGMRGDRYVAGCVYTDCDEFVERNSRGTYPDCCPKCKTPAKPNNKHRHHVKNNFATQKRFGYLTLEDSEDQLEREMDEQNNMEVENRFSNVPGIFYENQYSQPGISQQDSASVETEVETIDYFG